MIFISSAHYEHEVTPLREIQTSSCLQCKQPFNANKKIVWTRTSDTERVIWWHTRVNSSDPEPCHYLSTNEGWLKEKQKYGKA